MCRDVSNGFQLYQSDPSGNYGGWKATAIGANSQAAQNILKQDFKDEITLEEAVKLIIKVGISFNRSWVALASTCSQPRGLWHAQYVNALCTKFFRATLRQTLSCFFLRCLLLSLLHMSVCLTSKLVTSN